MSEAPIALVIEGARYGGWKTVSVVRSIESISGEFELTVSERYPSQIEQRRIRLGDECEIELEGEIVLTGYVDRVSPSHDAQSHGIGISGRDKTGDLVDCSAVHKPGEGGGLSLETIAAVLCEPFGIEVRADVSTGKTFERFRLQESETVFAAIERMARHRAVLAISDGLGGLVFTRAGEGTPATTPLVLGQNILAGSGTYSDRDRYNVYTVKGQRFGTDEVNSEAAASPVGRATDPQIKRFRPLTMIAEAQGDGLSLTDRARWEANRRAAIAQRPVVVVQGWSGSDGVLWRPNTIARVVDDWLEIDREMLITTVTYRDDENGIRCEIALARPEAFDLVALPEKQTTELHGLS